MTFIKNWELYAAPEIEIVDIAVEHGFEASSMIEDPVENPTQEW